MNCGTKSSGLTYIQLESDIFTCTNLRESKYLYKSANIKGKKHTSALAILVLKQSQQASV